MSTTPDQTQPAPERFDVAILGSGISGSMLAAILARNGVRTLLVDAATHPRFAVGESTIPYTLVALRTLAARYDVPEINAITTLENCTKHIAPTFGHKAHFGFLKHEEGEPQNPKHVNQFNTPKLLHEAHHLFRQDSDAYLFHAAVQHGAVPRQGLRITDVDLREDGVGLTGHDGSRYEVGYLVDASGVRSPLASKLGLRDEPCRLKHHSRSLWTHMQGVTPTDDLWDHAPADTPPKPWYTGTVHHLFSRGWFWVIAFDNTPLSRSPLCSVGLTLDERRYPKDPDLSPAEDFARHAARFPDVERQYRGAVAMREWTSTDRLQWSSKQTVGDRWCLLGHAAGFVDPLFSFGLANTCDAVNALAWRLLAAAKDGDFSAARFNYVDRLQQALITANDELVNAAYISWDHHDLWRAVFGIWAWGSNAGTYRAREALTKFQADGDDRHFLALEDAPHMGLPWPDHDGYAALFRDMVDRLDRVEAGTEEAPAAADALFDRFTAANFVPHPFGFSDRSQRFMNPTPKTLARTAKWAATEADPYVRRLMAGNGREAVKHVLRGERIF